ncbi:MAG TPA: ABATE domain-containing protein [Chloroflexota bacterium]|jgi:predicted RNA-binding Zn ribbon-like protein
MTPVSSDYVFDLDAGTLCLDFVNSRDSSGEHLRTYADLVAFAQQSSLVTPSDADWLHAQAEREPLVAQGVLIRALHLREALRGIFRAVADDDLPREADLSVLNGDLALSLPNARVQTSAEGFDWTWSGRALDCVLWPISRSAADLLTSPSQRRLVRQCGASDCEWLFLDTSKNRSRQWCSMQSCGNREKARRHYQRLKSRRAESSVRASA